MYVNKPTSLKYERKIPTATIWTVYAYWLHKFPILRLLNRRDEYGTVGSAANLWQTNLYYHP